VTLQSGFLFAFATRSDTYFRLLSQLGPSWVTDLKVSRPFSTFSVYARYSPLSPHSEPSMFAIYPRDVCCSSIRTSCRDVALSHGVTGCPPSGSTCFLLASASLSSNAYCFLFVEERVVRPRSVTPSLQLQQLPSFGDFYPLAVKGGI
jgi:hypothetical protein